LRKPGFGCNSRCPTPMPTIPQTHRYPRDRVLTGFAITSARCTDCAQSRCPDATASDADLGTKWEQDWQYQPNAASMYVRQGRIVTDLQSMPLSITATCFQSHEYGRRTGLKIRSSQEGVGSSPTFGTDCKMLDSVALRLKRAVGPTSIEATHFPSYGTRNLTR
jgi:hypothetical protein